MRLDLPPDIEERAHQLVGLTMARWQVDSEDDRDDIRQAAFLAAWWAVTTWEPGRGAALDTWIIGGVRNAVRMEARRIAPIPRRQQWALDRHGREDHPEWLPPVSLDAIRAGAGDLDHLEALESGEDPEARALERIRSAEVRRAISELAPRVQEMIVRYYWENQTHAEIGAAMGCSATNVGVRLRYAREHLREVLARDREEGVL